MKATRDIPKAQALTGAALRGEAPAVRYLEHVARRAAGAAVTAATREIHACLGADLGAEPGYDPEDAFHRGLHTLALIETGEELRSFGL